MKLRSIIEALLIASDSPLGADSIAQLVRAEIAQLTTSPPDSFKDLATTSSQEVTDCLIQLQAEFSSDSRGFVLLKKSNGWQICTAADFAHFVARLTPPAKRKKLPASLQETLAIIAYRQPICKFTIEDIRGVPCEAALLKLIDLDLIHISGTAELPGKPKLYQTTAHFFDTLGIDSLNQLPNIESSTEELTHHAT